MENRKWTNKISLLISIFLFFSLLPSHFSPLHAADPKKKLSEIEKKLKTKKKKVKESIKKEKSILTRIDDIDKSIRKKHKELKHYDERISQTRSKILTLSKEISALKGKLDIRKKHLKKRLKALYKQQYGGHALLLISAKDYQDLTKKSKYISLIAYYDSRIIHKYKMDIKEINSKKIELERLNCKKHCGLTVTKKTNCLQ
jgi:peptidoglycan hydrolase CwlO-like protein